MKRVLERLDSIASIAAIFQAELRIEFLFGQDWINFIWNRDEERIIQLIYYSCLENNLFLME